MAAGRRRPGSRLLVSLLAVGSARCALAQSMAGMDHSGMDMSGMDMGGMSMGPGADMGSMMGGGSPATSPSSASAPAPAPGMHADHAQHMAMGSAPMQAMAMSTAASAASSGPCYRDPGQASCRSFTQPDATSEADLDSLCGAMPFMVACSLRKLCQDGDMKGAYCRPFSLLADGCLDMSGMQGCANYNALCGNSSSVVEQCQDAGPLPRVPKTMEVRRSIAKMCGSHYMEGCQTCTGQSGFANCPDPLDTLSTLCLSMEGMGECRGFNSFCSASGASVDAVCTADQGHDPPPMRMYFHTGFYEVILFRGWMPQGHWQYALSCICVILIGVVVQAVRAARAIVEVGWNRRMCLPCKGGFGEAPPRGFMSLHQLRRNLARGGFGAVTTTLELFLMLVAMTFNAGLFISVVAGLVLGTVLFGHLLAAEPSGFTPTDTSSEGELTRPVAVHGAQADGCGCC